MNTNSSRFRYGFKLLFTWYVLIYSKRSDIVLESKTDSYTCYEWVFSDSCEKFSGYSKLRLWNCPQKFLFFYRKNVWCIYLILFKALYWCLSFRTSLAFLDFNCFHLCQKKGGHICSDGSYSVHSIICLCLLATRGVGLHTKSMNSIKCLHFQKASQISSKEPECRK